MSSDLSVAVRELVSNSARAYGLNCSFMPPMNDDSSPRKIQVRVEPGQIGHSVRVVVTDNGIGFGLEGFDFGEIIRKSAKLRIIRLWSSSGEGLRECCAAGKLTLITTRAEDDRMLQARAIRP